MQNYAADIYVHLYRVWVVYEILEPSINGLCDKYRIFHLLSFDIEFTKHVHKYFKQAFCILKK